MASPARRRLYMRLWMLLGVLMFAPRCAQQVKPMLQGFMGGPDKPETSAAQTPRTRQGLRLASWNLEWLNTQGRGVVPRSDADLARLARYAARLDPDIVAVQEVAQEESLARVFPSDRYRIHLAQQGGAQKTGFAYRKDLEVRVMPDLDALSEHGLRAGSDLEVTIDGRHVRLLAVHLKAFCVKPDIDTESHDCERLAEQVPTVERWIDARAKAGEAFAVLGDFNRLLDDADDVWRALDDHDPAGLRLTRTDAKVGSLCASQRKPRPFIDHIVLGGPATDWLVPDSFRELRYDETDKSAHVQLSDHCPILIELASSANEPRQ